MESLDSKDTGGDAAEAVDTVGPGVGTTIGLVDGEPAPLATGAFLRLDGGSNSRDDRARVAAGVGGVGAYVAGTIRRSGGGLGQAWVTRLEQSGLPAWHAVREVPFHVGE